MAEDCERKLGSDLLGTVIRPPSIRVNGSFKSTLSGRLTPRSSPSFRRSQSVRTTQRESRPATHLAPWYRRFSSRRLLPWLIVIGLWSYIGFHVQSRWAYSEGKDGLASFGSQLEIDQELRNHATTQQKAMEETFSGQKHLKGSEVFLDIVPGKNARRSDLKAIDPPLSPSNLKKWTKNWLWTGRSSARNAEQSPMSDTSSSRVPEERQTDVTLDLNRNIGDSSESESISWTFPSVGIVNSSAGKLVGPFHEIERRLLASTARKTLRSCETRSLFAGFVRGKTFLLVLHELSMTGAPLAMMELGSEIVSCGGKVSAVVLNRKGGLLQELLARGIKVLKDKAIASFRAATKVDVLVAGSALCASWLEQYLLFNKKGSRLLAWWIMENRREYFDRSKHMLSRAKLLIFLSESQSQQWQAWSQMEDVALPHKIEVVSLSINDEISFKAGLKEPHGFMSERRSNLRDQVRRKMGLEPTDVLLLTLSSITPGKGQLMLLEAFLMAIEGNRILHFENSSNSGGPEQALNHSESLDEKGGNKKAHQAPKLLIGSVGSKSNKMQYIQRMLDLIAEHPRLAKFILWTHVTVHVAPLYSAADVYVMNSQGIGETFGRVTIEAMAHGLPILGTDAGGTREIVENNVTGLLHPVGGSGVPVLAQHINYVVNNPAVREEMGSKGREKVKSMYLKELMYERLAQLFIDCLELDSTKRSSL